MVDTLVIKCQRAIEATGALDAGRGGRRGCQPAAACAHACDGRAAGGPGRLSSRRVLHRQRGDDRAARAAAARCRRTRRFLDPCPRTLADDGPGAAGAGRVRPACRQTRDGNRLPTELEPTGPPERTDGNDGHHFSDRPHGRMHHRHLGLGAEGQAEGRDRPRDVDRHPQGRRQRSHRRHARLQEGVEAAAAVRERVGVPARRDADRPHRADHPHGVRRAGGQGPAEQAGRAARLARRRHRHRASTRRLPERREHRTPVYVAAGSNVAPHARTCVVRSTCSTGTSPR